MNEPDLDRLLRQLGRHGERLAPDFASRVLDRLGPSAAQIRSSILAGVACCALAVALSAATAFLAIRGEADAPRALPPELTVLTRGARPLASL
jgi:hypothetical protein